LSGMEPDDVMWLPYDGIGVSDMGAAPSSVASLMCPRFCGVGLLDVELSSDLLWRTVCPRVTRLSSVAEFSRW
jgi:hypothetical protein